MKDNGTPLTATRDELKNIQGVTELKSIQNKA